jgi:hypothetical protein
VRIPGTRPAIFPCSGGGLLFLQGINSKRADNSLKCLALVAAEQQFPPTRTAPPARDRSEMRIGHLIQRQCGEFRVAEKASDTSAS